VPPRQFSFLPKTPLEHGGALRKGRRKIARPLDPKRAVHLVMRSTFARGERSMLHRKYKAYIHVMIEDAAEAHGVRIYRYSNVGNHLHFLLKFKTRAGFRAFTRQIAGAIAMMITGARKGDSLSKPFWDLLPYTRIVSWGREFETLKTYLIRNLLEGYGIPNRHFKMTGFAGRGS